MSDNGKWFYLKTDDDEKALEVRSYPLPDGFILQVGKSIRDRIEILERFHALLAGIMIPVIVIGLIGGAFFAFRALRPIRRLIDTIRSIIETGKMDARMPTGKRGDELDELGMLFNRMLGKIETLIIGMREGLDNVAHDLRTPLTRLSGHAEMALQSEGDGDGVREALRDCVEESERILAMLNTIMDISEAETGAMKLNLGEVNIPNLIEEAIDLYRYVAEEKSISIHATSPGALSLSADRNRLRQALANVLDNAIKYTFSGGRIDIESLQKDEQIVITIKDTGRGISPEDLPRIWDRLYRGDKSRSEHGLGLGLSLVKAIVQAHNGYVEVSSEPGVGSVLAIYLPNKL